MSGRRILPSHTITKILFPPLRANKPGAIRCDCGWALVVEPDRADFGHEWSPVMVAWAAHRRSVGLSVPSTAESQKTGKGWDGSFQVSTKKGAA